MEHKWVVVGMDMDGITGWQVCSTVDASEVQSGSYSGSVVKGLSRNFDEMQKLADELNAKNEPAPENPFRGVSWRRFQ